jgi:hypothetical protein
MLVPSSTPLVLCVVDDLPAVDPMSLKPHNLRGVIGENSPAELGKWEMPSKRFRAHNTRMLWGCLKQPLGQR